LIDSPGCARRAGCGTVAAPLAILALLLAQPALDAIWENHQAHFWLVFAAAAIATALGYSVTTAARARRDARLLLISFAFIASSGFLGLHALATPGVLLGPNAGFELATPVGLVVAGAFAAGASREFSRERALTVVRQDNTLLAALFGVMALWALVSLAELPPLDGPLTKEELDGWQLVLAAVGIAFYALATVGFIRLYRRRGHGSCSPSPSRSRSSPRRWSPSRAPATGISRGGNGTS
jgi:hypothetical protein